MPQASCLARPGGEYICQGTQRRNRSLPGLTALPALLQVPDIEGVVVCTEFEQAVRAAYEEEQKWVPPVPSLLPLMPRRQSACLLSTGPLRAGAEPRQGASRALMTPLASTGAPTAPPRRPSPSSLPLLQEQAGEGAAQEGRGGGGGLAQAAARCAGKGAGAPRLWCRQRGPARRRRRHGGCRRRSAGRRRCGGGSCSCCRRRQAARRNKACCSGECCAGRPAGAAAEEGQGGKGGKRRRDRPCWQ